MFDERESAMACLIEDITAILEEAAPPELAEEWDNVGLLVGAGRGETGAVLISLDATAEVIGEAAERGAGLLVCHHPPIFRPLSRVLSDEPQGAVIAKALASGTAIFAAHTNLDAAGWGVNAVLAEILGLENAEPLIAPEPGEGLKLVTFLPRERVAEVSGSLFEAGAGTIGGYRDCSFRVEGKGTFTPGPDSRPAYGEREARNQIDEVRLEVLVKAGALSGVLEALLSTHPYEEPAYDLYPLRLDVPGGLGRVGELKTPLTLGELAHECSRLLGAPRPRLAGDPDMRLERVAVCGGSGSKLIPPAVEMGAQALITGDVGYHEALDASARGLALIDAGHYHTERPIVERLAALLEQEVGKAGLEVDIHTSDICTCPWIHGGGV